MPVADNTARQRYELEENGETAFANYRRDGDTLVIPYVEAAMALRGTGAAGRLMQGVTEIARAEKLKIVPLCGYARGWLKAHKEHHDLLA